MNFRILHVEDNPDDVMLTDLAFRKAGTGVRLLVAQDGETAINILKQTAENQDPDLVLLDIKLPTISGLDVLGWIREQPRYQRMPVVMLTSSLLPEDINTAYDLGANSYLVKPAELATLVKLAGTIKTYWFETNVAARGKTEPAAQVN